MPLFDDRAPIVTGVAQGFGFAMAELFAEERCASSWPT